MQFAVLYFFGQDCLGMWLRLWTPCEESQSNFDLQAILPSTWDDVSGSAGPPVPFSLIHHRDICGQQDIDPGRCSRFVIEGLGELMVAKLTFTAFLTPALSLVLYLPWTGRALEAGARCLLRQPDYVYSHSLSGDSELAGMVMLMDLALIFGFAVPLVLPLICVAFASALAVFRLSKEQHGIQVDYEAKPACRYLAVSVLLGSSLNMWFFIDTSSHIVGEALVTVGVPVGLCVGLAIGAVWHWRCQSAREDRGDASGVTGAPPVEFVQANPMFSPRHQVDENSTTERNAEVIQAIEMCSPQPASDDGPGEVIATISI